MTIEWNEARPFWGAQITWYFVNSADLEQVLVWRGKHELVENEFCVIDPVNELAPASSEVTVEHRHPFQSSTDKADLSDAVKAAARLWNLQGKRVHLMVTNHAPDHIVIQLVEEEKA